MATPDIELGRKKLDWARSHMPVHAELRRLYGERRPLEGMTVAVCSHIEAKTGVLIETAAAAGARVLFAGSEPMSSQDDVVAALNAEEGITGYARRGATEKEFKAFHRKVLEQRPSFVLDDAAELTARLVHEYPETAARLAGMCEQTTTGVQRMQAMAREGRITFPAYAVNDTPMKRLFDNVHGTGESSLTNLLMCTNLLLAGKRVVVAGFGFCGRGVARKARGWGARVMVTEVDPRKALQAHMEGFEVGPMAEAARHGELFVTTTGNRDVLRREHFERMPDDAVISNAGHFNVEIDREALEDMAAAMREVRPGITEYRLADGRRLNVVAEGHLVNLAAPGSMGHPVEVMDQTFAVQLAAAVHLVEHREELGPGVHAVPDAVDRQVAELKLRTLGIAIDDLTEGQRRYVEAWRIEDINPDESEP
ncbi:MAG: adenosylhomocysteinase [Gammaproteobacteria bacterium]|nr:adenosylhomocysteinase [Gammaproteobacteria bacterium]